MAEVVSIEKVSYGVVSPSRHEVVRMRGVLERQGQIEPLQVRRSLTGFITFPQDVWAPAIVQAARELGWPTLLIAEMGRYEL
jgi:hypothetical protein